MKGGIRAAISSGVVSALILWVCFFSPALEVTTAAPTLSPTPVAINVLGGIGVPITLFIEFDKYPGETSWSMVCSGIVYANNTSYSEQWKQQLLTQTFSVPEGSPCEFKINDTHGDGICCSDEYGNGFYMLYLGEDTSIQANLIGSGGDFSAMDKVTFTAAVPPAPSPPTPMSCAVDLSKFNMCVDTVSSGGYSSDWTVLVSQAKARWESVITRDTCPGVPASDLQSLGIPVCSNLPQVVDDIYVCARDLYIDGPGGILGQSEITAVSTFENGGFPMAGYINFDSADLQSLLDASGFDDIILHEMGHLLGIGSMWASKGLVSRNNTNSQWVYSGTNACTQWQSVSNCNGCPPIENDFDQATPGRHWDEAAMDHELMTGFAEPSGAPNPLSKVTVGTLQDLGYTVDYSKADAYPGNLPISCGDEPGRQGRVRHRQRRQIKTAERPKLSVEGLKIAHQYGEQLLASGKKNKQTTPSGGQVEYAAGQHVSVVYQEKGVTFFVDVYSDEK